AVSIRIGHFTARGDMIAVRNAWKAGIFITLVTQAIAALVFVFLPHWVVGLYSQTDDVAALAIQLLSIAAIFQIVDGLQVIGMGALRGMNDTAYAFKATMVSFWIFGVISVAVAYYAFDKSPHGVWYGLLVGLTFASAFHHTRMFFRTKAR